MNRSAFFDAVRDSLFAGHIEQSQVDGLTKILDEWERRKLTDERWLANMLAQTYWETGRKMQPIPEGGGAAYLTVKPYYPWYGRGLVQCTWQANYAKFGCTNPADMLSWPMALKALFDGMINGAFTGKKLSDYFSATVDDPFNARKILNGVDKADIIAAYHRQFLAALTASGPPIAIPRPVAPPHLPAPPPPQGFWAGLWGRLTGKTG